LLVLGSQVLVKGAITAASAMGVSQSVIGLTVVSAGTSMPELVTSLVAAYRGKADLAIGNVVGSNLLNQLMILGLCATFSGEGLLVEPTVISRDFPIMVSTTLACLPIFWSGGVINRSEGFVLVGLYVLYLTEQVLVLTASGTVVDQFRLVVLVVVIPLVLVFLAWQVLSWRRKRNLIQSP
jgi:cation:H+ antiporter